MDEEEDKVRQRRTVVTSRKSSTSRTSIYGTARQQVSIQVGRSSEIRQE
jgi:hypothetical protein